MISSWTLYWILMLDKIHGFFVALLAISFIAMIVFCIVYIATSVQLTELEEKVHDSTARAIKPSAIIAMICGLILVLTPNTKTMALIYVVPKMANSEVLLELQGDALELYRMGVSKAKEMLNTKTTGEQK